MTHVWSQPFARGITFSLQTDPSFKGGGHIFSVMPDTEGSIRKRDFNAPHKGSYSRAGREQTASLFCSLYFLIPKRNGSFRPILDLRGLNKYLLHLRFRMVTVPRVKQAIQQDNWFACIDLKNAYFQVPIWQGHRQFLRYAFESKVFKF